jgi:ribosomal protein S27E
MVIQVAEHQLIAVIFLLDNIMSKSDVLKEYNKNVYKKINEQIFNYFKKNNTTITQCANDLNLSRWTVGRHFKELFGDSNKVKVNCTICGKEIYIDKHGLRDGNPVCHSCKNNPITFDDEQFESYSDIFV